MNNRDFSRGCDGHCLYETRTRKTGLKNRQTRPDFTGQRLVQHILQLLYPYLGFSRCALLQASNKRYETAL